ncbi:MAG: MBL fold metallo-hydrolase [Acetivibrio sp.]
MKIKIMVLGMVRTNCYILNDETTKQAIVIDPGDEGDKICAYMKENDLKLMGIFLTHGHFDHITGLQDLKDTMPAKVYAAKAEQELLMNPQWNCSESFGNFVTAQVDQFLEDGQSIEIASMQIKVLATPGHTRGGVCYYFEQEKVLFSGDTLFFESIGRTDLPTGNGQIILESVAKKLMPLPDEIQVYPGHGNHTSIGYERRNNPYVNGNDWD